MIRYLPFAAAVVLLSVCTLVQGWHVQRFSDGTTEKMEEMARRFSLIPMDIGDWAGEDQDMSKEELKAAGAHAALRRRYVNLKNNSQIVDVFMICGFGRHVAVHTPERCFLTPGVEQHDSTIQERIRDEENKKTYTFRTAKFVKTVEGKVVSARRTYWGWNEYAEGEGEWEGPDNARNHFGGWKPLTKLYLTMDAVKGSAVHANHPVKTFAVEFLPEVNSKLGNPAEEE